MKRFTRMCLRAVTLLSSVAALTSTTLGVGLVQAPQANADSWGCGGLINNNFAYCINSESQYGQKIEDPWIPTAANQKYMDQSKIVRRCLTSSDAHCTSDYTPVPARTGGRPGQEAVAPAPAWAALGIRTRDCADSRLAAVLERRFGSATHLRLSGGGGQLLAPAADRQQALRLAHQVREDLGGGVWISVAWRPYEELVSGVCEMENVLTVVCALKRRPGSISSATWPWSARWRAARRCPGALRR